jgi:uncharacterized RmlC-like cupin family protein
VTNGPHEPVNLAEKLAQFDEHWSPRTVAAFNGHDPGELFVVPVGVEHQPFAAEEAELLLIEPSGTPNTGDPATAAKHIAI